jgi:hypothetical protein
MEYFDIEKARARLEASNGGWEGAPITEPRSRSARSALPTPDRPVSHTADEGLPRPGRRGDPREADGASRRLRPEDAAFVAVGNEHHFVDYELVSVLVLFARGG